MKNGLVHFTAEVRFYTKATKAIVQTGWACSITAALLPAVSVTIFIPQGEGQEGPILNYLK